MTSRPARATTTSDRSAARGRGRRARTAIAIATSALVAGAVALPAGAQAPADGPAAIGRFLPPFVEPTIGDVTTADKCIERDDGSTVCKPSAGSLGVLPDGRIFYWSALEALENVETGAVPEFGLVAENDQSRILDLRSGTPTWKTPLAADGGASAQEKRPLLTMDFIAEGGDRQADGALFGSDQVYLADGRLLTASGTDYYNEFGAVELEGLRATRIFDYRADGWSQTGDLNTGRWYPTLVSTGDGNVLAFSGVSKLIKTAYSDEPEASGQNVHTVERYDAETGEWTLLPATADRPLPLYPRMRLLPNGQIFFATNGQSFNPNGYDINEAGWNTAAAFDPSTDTWTDLGVPISGTDIGYRGSTFSTMLPLRPNAAGVYDKVEILSAGGTLGSSPGSYIPVANSRVFELSIDEAGAVAMDVRTSGGLNQARWYGHGTLLPTGEVFVTSGADKDHVIAPGSEVAITTPELYDPETGTFTPVAEQAQERTYHNSATLLPDGRVLVGGHNPIAFGYGSYQQPVPGNAPNDGRDPTFEIFEPPYLFRGDRPGIVAAPTSLQFADEAVLQLDVEASEIRDVILMRLTAETHIIDGDQRAVELPILTRAGRNLTVATPPDGFVAPPGPYMLFVNRETTAGPVPSEAVMVSVTATGAVVPAPQPEPAPGSGGQAGAPGPQLPATGGGAAPIALGAMLSAVLAGRALRRRTPIVARD